MKVKDRENFIKMMEANGISVSPLHHRSDTHSIFQKSKRSLPNMDNGTRNLFISLVDGGSETKKERESWKQ